MLHFTKPSAELFDRGELADTVYGTMQNPRYPHETPHYIASNAYCNTAAPLATSYLRRQGLPAITEAHEHKIASMHVYSVIPAAHPDNDLVIDCTYKQYAHPDHQDILRNVFVGTRKAMAALMCRVALEPGPVFLYHPSTLIGTTTGDPSHFFELALVL